MARCGLFLPGLRPVTLAFPFPLHESCEIVTNLLGGWIAARMGLRVTLVAGLALQVTALGLPRAAVNPEKLRSVVGLNEAGGE